MIAGRLASQVRSESLEETEICYEHHAYILNSWNQEGKENDALLIKGCLSSHSTGAEQLLA